MQKQTGMRGPSLFAFRSVIKYEDAVSETTVLQIFQKF